MSKQQTTAETVNKPLAVAKDVLKQLRYLTVSSGHYCYGTLPEQLPEGVTDLQGIVKEVQKHCTVCPLGAALISKARLFGNVPLEHLVYSSVYDEGDDKRHISPTAHTTRDNLLDVFTRKQLGLIETAFETRFSYASFAGCSEEEAAAAYQFGDHYDDDKERLKAIYQNIVKNDGVFKP